MSDSLTFDIFYCGDDYLEERYVGMEIYSLAKMTMRFMESNSHKSLVDSITGTNGWILGIIDHNKDKEIFQRDIEEKFGITRSTVSKVVNLMVQKGLIERSSVDYDARLKKLSLTDKSRKLIEYMHEDHKNMDDVLLEGFSEDEINTLFDFLGRMKRNIKSTCGCLGKCFKESGEDLFEEDNLGVNNLGE